MAYAEIVYDNGCSMKVGPQQAVGRALIASAMQWSELEGWPGGGPG